ncbi:hypothetical protein MMC10_010984 [Thelotrema lepadinum]|nr:hypothetical protein [Thelotrema lepadinum]
MSSSTPQTPQPALLATPNYNRDIPLESSQPKLAAPMDPQAPHPEQKTQPELHLRGGDLCPGRFCFCIPCPIPCDFCII